MEDKCPKCNSDLTSIKEDNKFIAVTFTTINCTNWNGCDYILRNIDYWDINEEED